MGNFILTLTKESQSTFGDKKIKKVSSNECYGHMMY